MPLRMLQRPAAGLHGYHSPKMMIFVLHWSELERGGIHRRVDVFLFGPHALILPSSGILGILSPRHVHKCPRQTRTLRVGDCSFPPVRRLSSQISAATLLPSTEEIRLGAGHFAAALSRRPSSSPSSPAAGTLRVLLGPPRGPKLLRMLQYFAPHLPPRIPGYSCSSLSLLCLSLSTPPPDLEAL